MPSTNGHDDPNEIGFPVPMWILVNDPPLGIGGLPETIARISRPGDPAGGLCLVVFASQEDAQRIVGKGGVAGPRPLMISDLAVFIGILSGLIRNGLQYVVRYAPDRPGANVAVCRAEKVRDLLSDYVRTGSA